MQMSDIAPAPQVTAPAPVPLSMPVDAQHTDYTAPANPAPVSIAQLVQPAPAPVAAPVQASTPGGNAGLAEYVGDFAQSLDAILPAKVRALLYPLGFLVSATAVGLGFAHVLDGNSAFLIAISAQAFTNGLALGNVPKGK